jgi:hypothetical protein
MKNKLSKIKNYYIIQDGSVKDLSGRVDSFIKLGWEPCGNMTHVFMRGFFQPMVYFSSPEKEKNK